MPRPASHKIPGLFLLGTDTSVGKTTIAVALLRALVDAGHRPVPHKPVETGANPIPSDAVLLQKAANRTDLPLEIICPHHFAPPVAPAAAAAMAGSALPPDQLVLDAKAAARHGTFLIVEAAGGLLTPYAPGTTAADLAAALHLPILLIARNGLGTINHTALAVSELRRRRLPILGIVLVNTTPVATPDQPFNASLIADLTGLSPLGVFPFLPSPTPQHLAAALHATLRLPPSLARLLNGPRPQHASGR